MRNRRVLASCALSFMLVIRIAEGQPAPAPEVNVKADVFSGELSPSSNYSDSVSVGVTDTAGQPVAGAIVHAIVLSGDIVLYAPGKANTKDLDLKTDSKGIATFSFITGTQPASELLIVPYAGGAPLLNKAIKTTVTLGARYKDALSSRRAYYQLFFGQTFSNDYDANGVNTGFGNSGQITRLTFDTMWKRPVDWRSHEPASPQEPSTWARVMNALALQSPGLRHTELNIEVSKFPFGGGPGTPPNKPLENAFSGTVGYSFQPDAWASYSPTSKSDLPNDAVRFGLFSRAGITSRSEKAKSGANAIDRFQIGFKFTHHQTRAASPRDEIDNYTPIRFVEVSYERFSEFAGVAHANRLVFDAGIRLTPLSNNVLPFYAGIHANTGKGQKDVRLFVGILAKLDKLAELIKANPFE